MIKPRLGRLLLMWFQSLSLGPIWWDSNLALNSGSETLSAPQRAGERAHGYCCYQAPRSEIQSSLMGRKGVYSHHIQVQALALSLTTYVPWGEWQNLSASVLSSVSNTTWKAFFTEPLTRSEQPALTSTGSHYITATKLFLSSYSIDRGNLIVHYVSKNKYRPILSYTKYFYFGPSIRCVLKAIHSSYFSWTALYGAQLYFYNELQTHVWIICCPHVTPQDLFLAWRGRVGSDYKLL